MSGQKDTVQPSPEDAIDYLLEAAIDRFGRDVFFGVFNYSAMISRHGNAIDIEYAELQAAVSALSKM
jgi:hypothetical protein